MVTDDPCKHNKPLAECEFCDVANYFEKAETEYGPRLTKILEATRACLVAHGWDCTEVFDITCDDIEYTFTASKEPDDTDEASIDFNAKMCLSEDYDGEPNGVTFRIDVNRFGGEVITSCSPYNYSPQLWVPRDDMAAVSERLNILEHLDPESILPLIERKNQEGT